MLAAKVCLKERHRFHNISRAACSCKRHGNNSRRVSTASTASSSQGNQASRQQPVGVWSQYVCGTSATAGMPGLCKCTWKWGNVIGSEGRGRASTPQNLVPRVLFAQHYPSTSEDFKLHFVLRHGTGRHREAAHAAVPCAVSSCGSGPEGACTASHSLLEASLQPACIGLKQYALNAWVLGMSRLRTCPSGANDCIGPRTILGDYEVTKTQAKMRQQNQPLETRNQRSRSLTS